ncbi:MAG TPA: site-2 protease family protein [Blastocatellia bacterium]|jgi:Zn-dependent protease/predicted transcriptional regulator
METDIKLGKLFGIEIGVSYSWFVIFFLITFSLWGDYKQKHSDWPDSWHVIAAVATSFLFFLSIVIHELSHSLLARAKGLPVHSITLFIFGGVSRIEKEAMNATTELLVGIVGPISSAALAGIFHLISQAVEEGSPIGAMTRWLAIINLTLAVFNLIPGYPLDGGRVLRAAVWGLTGDMRKATRVAIRVGQGFAYMFIIAGASLALASRENVVSGLWMAFIGWFLLNAAKSSQGAMVFEQAMRGARARDVMSAGMPTVPADISLEEFFEHYLMRTGQRCFMVNRNGDLLGLITTHELKAEPRERWTQLTVERAMRPIETVQHVTPDADLQSVVELMEKEDLNQVPVIGEYGLEGMIRRENIVRFIKTRAEFDY